MEFVDQKCRKIRSFVQFGKSIIDNGVIMKHTKTALFIGIFAALFGAGLAAQQITNVGVVDTGRVYTTYFRESAAVRNYDSKKAEFQAEIDRRTATLKSLQDKSSNTKKTAIRPPPSVPKRKFQKKPTFWKPTRLQKTRNWKNCVKIFLLQMRFISSCIRL